LRALRGRNIQFMFVTGYSAETIPIEFADVARLAKPCDALAVARAIKAPRPSWKGLAPLIGLTADR